MEHNQESNGGLKTRRRNEEVTKPVATVLTKTNDELMASAVPSYPLMIRCSRDSSLTRAVHQGT